MGDSDSERDDAGSDGEDDSPTFDPTKDLEKMTEKQRKKWESSLKKWRLFMDFLFRHVAIVTFRYNCFEAEEMTQFMLALERAEALREASKLKKGEEARISSFRVMKDCTDMLLQQKYVLEANRIRKFLDLAGRMRGLGTIAGGFYKALKKGKVRGADKIKYYLDYWKGFSVRSFDYTELTFRNADSASFNELEKKYLVWPTVVKTALHLSNRFLKRASESTGLELMSTDPKTMQQHMQAAEFVVATKIEDMLAQKVVAETKSFLIGGNNPLLNPPVPDNPKYEMPLLEEINPKMLVPIADTGVLMNLPEEPPKEKKKGKKGKGKKGGKGRSVSASSHKGGKKKRKK